jgi:hypothetical protein
MLSVVCVILNSELHLALQLTCIYQTILWIISVDFNIICQMLIKYFAFVGYCKELGVQKGSMSVIYRLHESLHQEKCGIVWSRVMRRCMPEDLT